MSQNPSLLRLLRQVHEDEDGAVSLETILIIGAIALPILIFIIKFGWPKIRQFFDTGMQDLQNNTNNLKNGSQ